MNGGAIVLADEPTGALDHASGQQVMAELKRLHAQGHTVILVTHDAAIAANAARVIEIADYRWWPTAPSRDCWLRAQDAGPSVPRRRSPSAAHAGTRSAKRHAWPCVRCWPIACARC